MFKLAVFLAVVAVVAAKPGYLSAPALALAPAIETRTAIIGEKTIESHGNSVVHASAPVITSYAAPAVATYSAAAPALHTSAVIAEKTVEAHGNSIVHASAPVVTSYAAPAVATYAAAPAIATYAAAPAISYSAPLLYGAPGYQKTITSYGSLLHGAHLL